MLIPLLLLYQYTKKEVGSSSLADFTVHEAASSQNIHGLGMNVLDLKNGNIVLNNSFEPLTYRQNLIIDDGDERMIKVAMPDDDQINIFPDHFFINAKVNVLSNDENGERYLKKTGVVESYTKDQIDHFYPFSLPNNLPKNILWTDLAENKNHILFTGSDGYLLSLKSFTDVHLFQTTSKADIVGATEFEQDFLILDKKGNVYRLNEKKELTFWFNANALELNKSYAFDNLDQIAEAEKNPLSWTDCIARQNNDGEWSFMAVGEKGHYLYASDHSIMHKKLKDDFTINAITANEDGYYLVGDHSLGFYTINGENFRYLDIAIDTNWQDIVARHNQLLLVGKHARVLYSDDGFNFQDVYDDSIRDLSIAYSQQFLSDDSSIILSPDFMKAAILSSDQFVLIDIHGNLYITDDQGSKWQSDQEMQFTQKENTHLNCQFLQRVATGQIVAADRQGNFSYAMMGLQIQLDSQPENIRYQRGDIIELEQISTMPLKANLSIENDLAGEWYVTDIEAAEIQLEEHAPDGGLTALQIDLDTAKPAEQLTGLYQHKLLPYKGREGIYTLQQMINPQSYPVINENTFFQYEFWAKSSENATVEVSLQNLNVDIEPSHKELDSEWQKYRGVLILPKNSLAADKDAALTFSFSGKGEVYLDQIWFGTVEDRETDLAQELQNQPQGSVLRMNYLPVAMSGYAPDSWMNSSETVSVLQYHLKTIENKTQFNLANSLKLAKDLKMNPWIMIDSQTTDLELRHLIQYMFGLENTTYGNLRLEQSGIGRSGDLFEQIYIEICDTDHLMIGDTQKRAYVDWVIKTIADTPEYQQIKNNLIFVDGMQYKENRMLSTADYHASDLTISQCFKNKADLDEFNDSIYELIPRDIERTFDARAELIRSIKINSGDIRLADLMATSLNMLGEEQKLALLDVDLSTSNINYQFYESFGRLGTLLRGLNAYSVESKIEQDKVVAYAFGKGDKRVVVLINLADEVTSCQVSNLTLENYQQMMYDASGTLIEEAMIKRDNKVFSLLPGGVLILNGVENGQ